MSDRTPKPNQPLNPDTAQVTSTEEFAKTQPITDRPEDDGTMGLNDSDRIATLAGVPVPDTEALHVREMVEDRDRDRWELDPDSAKR